MISQTARTAGWLGLAAFLAYAATGGGRVVGSDEVTMLELAETILKLSGSKSKIEHRELPVDDPRQRQPDITRARTMLEWEPRVGLEDGLQKTLEYFRTVVA